MRARMEGGSQSRDAPSAKTGTGSTATPHHNA